MSKPLTYSNPRVNAEIPNWPMGGTTRGTAVFYIEQNPSRGERGCRITKHDDSGKVGKPKLLTFAKLARIVDGDDGKTYLIMLTAFNFIYVMQSNMQFQQESIFADDPQRYAGLLTLFKEPVA